MISDAVAAPGNRGSSKLEQASMIGIDDPGETPNTAPADLAASAWAGLSMLPAPTTHPETEEIRSMAANAISVRRVTSMTCNPPSANADASGIASASFEISKTGMTGTCPRVASRPLQGRLAVKVLLQ